VIGQLQGLGRRHTADVLPPSFQSSFSHRSQVTSATTGHQCVAADKRLSPVVHRNSNDVDGMDLSDVARHV